jgi:hypothetical protein
MAFPAEKDALLAILKENNCNATKDIYNNLNSYADIPIKYFKYSKYFDGDNALFDQLAVLWDDAGLTGAGVYYNKTGITITNPKLVGKSTNVVIEINAGGNFGPLEIADLSQVDEIIINGATNVEYIAVSGGSVVDKITIEAGSSVGVVMVKSENGLDSSVLKIDGPEQVETIVDEGATFGGFECNYVPL